jgi:hypothetical protein
MPPPREINALFGLRGSRPNIADKGSKTSMRIAHDMFRQMRITRQDLRSSQETGREFEKAVERFLANKLPRNLNGRRVLVSSQQASAFEQYAHLDEIGKLIKNDRTGTLSATIGIDYRVKPDVTVSLSRTGADAAFLHAAVQCKWTLRSDRAQNVRHDAVTLIRSRRGRVPHIVPVSRAATNAARVAGPRDGRDRRALPRRLEGACQRGSWERWQETSHGA